MPWELEIHHIDVNQGDSTLIIARHSLNGVINYTRSALIDGGRYNQTQTIHNYITNTAGLQALDVMVATHYDGDHIGGLRGLLNMQVNHYNRVRIYDQGHPQAYWDVIYHLYCQAINNNHQQIVGGGPRNRIRVTNNVLSDNVPTILPLAFVGQPAVPAGGAGAINQLAHTLVNQEILWPGAQNIPAGQPPQIFCIAANGYVLQAQGGTLLLGGLRMLFDANGKSLAFLVEFNNFKYYIGGDIETIQEDGNGNNNGIMHTLNPNNNLAGRVHAMKTSHHGSAASTSRAFVSRLRPIAAFISCGFNNQFFHPRQEVVNVLEGYGQNDYLANLNNPAQPHAQPNPANQGLPNPPIGLGRTPHHEVENYYLTNDRGYQNNFLGSGADIISGNQPLLGGHIVLRVNHAQSLAQPNNNNVNHFNVTYNHPPFINGNFQTTNAH